MGSSPKGRSNRKTTATRLGLLAAAAVAACAGWVLWLPDVRPLKKANPATTAMIALRRRQAAAKGQTFQLRMAWKPWRQISDHLKNAVLTAEDDMFYRHKGIDWEAVKLALNRDWETKSLAYGGSTITQQVAKNLYLSPSRNPLRKLKEALIAARLERELGKRRILEIYLNIAEWGKGIFGAEAAAQAYFGKAAADLSPDEAAALAAVLPNPRRWSASSTTSRYVARNTRRILGRMKASGMLPDEAETVSFEEPVLSTSTEVASISTAPAAGEALLETWTPGTAESPVSTSPAAFDEADLEKSL